MTRAPERGSAGGGTSRRVVEEIGDGDGLVARWAEPTGANPSAEGVAVRAALLAERAGLAGGALVDGGRPWCARREQDRGQPLLGVADPPGSLTAGIRAEASATGRAEAAAADRAGYRYAIVTRREIRHGAPPVRLCVLET